MAKVAVEGLERDIVPIICKILEHGKHQVCYSHESPLLKVKSSTINDIVNSNPDLTIICNARGYIKFLKDYSQITDIPSLVLTGGGPEFEEKAAKYTKNVMAVPFNLKDFYDKISSILNVDGKRRVR